MRGVHLMTNAYLLRPSTRISTAAMVDLTDPTSVEISVSEDGRHVHVNVDGVCLLRANGSWETTVEMGDNMFRMTPGAR